MAELRIIGQTERIQLFQDWLKDISQKFTVCLASSYTWAYVWDVSKNKSVYIQINDLAGTISLLGCIKPSKLKGSHVLIREFPIACLDKLEYPETYNKSLQWVENSLNTHYRKFEAWVEEVPYNKLQIIDNACGEIKNSRTLEL